MDQILLLWQGEEVARTICAAEFPQLYRSVGFGKGRIELEPSTLDVANALIKRCQSIVVIVTATLKGSEGSLGRGEREFKDTFGHFEKPSQ